MKISKSILHIAMSFMFIRCGTDISFVPSLKVTTSPEAPVAIVPVEENSEKVSTVKKEEEKKPTHLNSARLAFLNSLANALQPAIGASVTVAPYDSYIDFDDDGKISEIDINVILSLPDIPPGIPLASLEVVNRLVASARIHIGTIKGHVNYFEPYDEDGSGAVTAGDVGRLRLKLLALLQQ